MRCTENIENSITVLLQHPPSWFVSSEARDTYLQKHCHFWLIHELYPRFNQLWHVLQMVRILFDESTDMFQLLLLSSGDDLGHFILPLLQDAIQVIKLLTEFLFLFSAAFLLVGLANVSVQRVSGEITWAFQEKRNFTYVGYFFFLSPQAILSVYIPTVFMCWKSHFYHTFCLRLSPIKLAKWMDDFVFFLMSHAACRIWVPWPGTRPGVGQWKC